MTFEIRAEWGQRLRTLREQRAWSLQQLAKHAGVSKAWVARIEVGDGEPSTDVRMRLAAALGVEVLDIFNYPSVTP